MRNLTSCKLVLSASLMVLAISIQATAFASDPEVHAIGISTGNQRTADMVHGPRADIVVDRPNRDVILTLGSRNPSRWHVATTPHTRILLVILHGHGAEEPEILMNGKRFHDFELLKKTQLFQ